MTDTGAKAEEPEVAEERNLSNIVTLMNGMAMDVSRDAKVRKAAITCAENAERILSSIRKNRRKALRSELKT
jgi:hypothetical protein